MATTLTATFDTRREAEMTVERLVQEHGIDPNAITITADGDENTAGTDQAGSDAESAAPSPPARDDAALNGAVTVSVECDDEAMSETVKDAFVEFDSAGVVEN